SISKARSYAEIREFWDEHGLSDFWKKTKKVKFDVVLEPEATYYFVERICRRRSYRWNVKGVFSDTLVKNRAVSAEKAYARRADVMSWTPGGNSRQIDLTRRAKRPPTVLTGIIKREARLHNKCSYEQRDLKIEKA